jgi:ketosteroid isomerase-like protein
MLSMLRIFAPLVLSALLVPQSDPQALQRMVATERAFAAATAEIGVRDGFLTFFADDAIDISPGATGGQTSIGRAKDGLLNLAAPKLPLPTRLMWEPFTGQISTDGSIGWLTGATVSLNPATRDVVRKGAYFSVWKRQADGTWRVWLDEGIALPEVWTGASPFRAAPDPDAGTVGAAGESLNDAERAAASGGDAWRARLAEHARLHRDGLMPLVGRDAISQWAAGAWTGVRYSIARTELSASGDLGFVIGGYDRAAEHGTYVQVWKRDVTDRWRIVFETSRTAR